jgi:hypothetical protein
VTRRRNEIGVRWVGGCEQTFERATVTTCMKTNIFTLIFAIWLSGIGQVSMASNLMERYENYEQGFYIGMPMYCARLAGSKTVYEMPSGCSALGLSISINTTERNFSIDEFYDNSDFLIFKEKINQRYRFMTGKVKSNFARKFTQSGENIMFFCKLYFSEPRFLPTRKPQPNQFGQCIAEISDRGNVDQWGRDRLLILNIKDPSGLFVYMPTDLDTFQVRIQALLSFVSDVNTN